MAEAVVSAVVADAVGRAMTLLAGRLRDRRDVEGKLRRLRHLVVKLESAVDAADARRIASRALLEWLSELADGAHRGRYFLDAFSGDEAADLGEGDGQGDGGMRRGLFSPSSFNPAKRLRVAARRILFRGGGGAGELDSVLASVEGVSGDLTEFIMLLQCCPPALHRPLATNIYVDCQMFGRHLERRRVIDFLLQDDGDGDGGDELGVLPIIGRAGLGKTTLVQHVCDEPAVRRRFSLILMLDFHCMSLTVASETVQLLRYLFNVAATSSASAGEILGLLERKLRDERFLAVFDNVDTRRRQAIDSIMPALRRGRRGSRVLVTGTGKHVADLGTTEPVVLRPLPPAEYWFFFKAHAFGGAGDAEADPRLAAVGQAIAERLRGSFFGAKVVGALLRSRRQDHRLWRRVLAASLAEPSWLDNGGYVAAAAGSLLPPHVKVSGVAVSGSPVRGLVGLPDASLTTPVRDSGSGRPELPVLLCKSIFPSYCLYYTAYCTIDREDNKQ